MLALRGAEGEYLLLLRAPRPQILNFSAPLSSCLYKRQEAACFFHPSIGVESHVISVSWTWSRGWMQHGLSKTETAWQRDLGGLAYLFPAH
ncbi:rCG49528 [Rattus norvegicus]|uniref:RCG49528 n=1 Tax=Rattus norvegicus TaxID=10116 RepID=A6J3E8_RAT|nr:rCG49528 [Rattus norvegicus]